jgi:hypothetical protein
VAVGIDEFGDAKKTRRQPVATLRQLLSISILETRAYAGHRPSFETGRNS